MTVTVKEKRCSKCRTLKPASEFHKQRENRTGLRSACKACVMPQRAAQPAYRDRSKQRAREEQEYQDRLVAQGGVCGCCRRPWVKGEQRFCGDHDHTCCASSRASQRCGTCERELICRKCNIGLGHFDDDPEKLLAAMAYLGRHQRRTIRARRSSSVRS